MFLTCVIKVNKTEVLRLCVKHVNMLCCFQCLHENYPISIIFDSLEQANFICF